MAWLFNLIVKLTGVLPWMLIARPKVYYEDRSIQGTKITGKAIIVPNHTDVWDFAAMMFLFPMRILRCVVAELMYEKNWFMKLLLNGLGTIRVDRNNPDFAFMAKCCDILDKGGVVEIYPESKLPTAEQKELLPFKPSVTRIALESGAPIIPIYTDGNYFCKQRNRIMIGKPIDVRELYDDTLDETENIARITEILRGKINELKQRIQEE